MTNLTRLSHVPWGTGDLIRLSVGSTLAVIGVAAGWVGSSGTASARDDRLWLALGISSVVVSGVTNARWLHAGRRAVRQRCRAVTGRVKLAVRPVAVLPAPMKTLVAAPVMQHFHRPTCPMALGKTMVAETETDHRRAGRVPCGICRPLEAVR